MKKCTHCGTSRSAAAFCPECKNAFRLRAGKKPNLFGFLEKIFPKKKKTIPPARPKPEMQNSPPRPKKNPMDENYDGYYDDRLPDDNGQDKDGLEPEMVKQIALIAGGTIAILILAIILMYAL